MRLEHLVANIGARQGVVAVRRGEDLRLGRMRQALGEFVVAGDMVEVGVAGHRQQRSFGEPGQLLAQADQTGAAVHQHVALAALDMPHVAAIEGAHVARGSG